MTSFAALWDHEIGRDAVALVPDGLQAAAYLNSEK